MRLIGFLLGLFALGCSATVTASTASEADAGTPDANVSVDVGQPAADAGAQDATPSSDRGRRMPDYGGCYDLGHDPNPNAMCSPGCWYIDGSPIPYHDSLPGERCVRLCFLSGQLSEACLGETDAGPRYPISARISPLTPPARSLPPNATGVFAAAFEMTDEVGGDVPIRTVFFRRVGVGSPSDIAGVYDYGVTRGSIANTPFRYSTARTINSDTNIIAMPFGGSTIRPHATATHLLYVDFAPGTTGAQHAFELTGILVENGTSEGLLIPIVAVRSNPITLNGDRAGRLDVQPGPSIDYLASGIPSTAVVSVRMRAGHHDLDLVRFALAQGGSVQLWNELFDLELWRGSERIAIAEWTNPLNGYIVISPITPIYLPANSTTDFIIRGRVTAPAGRTLRIYAEYPTDVQAIDRALGTPAETDQSSFNGIGRNASEAVVTN